MLHGVKAETKKKEQEILSLMSQERLLAEPMETKSIASGVKPASTPVRICPLVRFLLSRSACSYDSCCKCFVDKAKPALFKGTACAQLVKLLEPAGDVASSKLRPSYSNT